MLTSQMPALFRSDFLEGWGRLQPVSLFLLTRTAVVISFRHSLRLNNFQIGAVYAPYYDPFILKTDDIGECLNFYTHIKIPCLIYTLSYTLYLQIV